MGLCTQLSNHTFDLVSNAKFPYSSGDILFFTKEDIPICSGLMLAYFLKRQHNLIVNVVDYDWKCSYQRGAMAAYNILKYKTPICNFYYSHNRDDAMFYDIFMPKLSTLEDASVIDEIETGVLLVKKCQRLS